MEKDFGVFYTPQHIVEFSVRALLQSVDSCLIKDVLEPSAGDGRFIKELFNKLGDSSFRSRMIEINSQACKELEFSFASKLDLVEIENKDFLFCDLENNSYDVILGNPPYISKKRLNKLQLERFHSILDEFDMPHTADKNIWVAFILRCSKALRCNGVMSFILPFELLQVKFAESLQLFLENRFDRIEVYTFRKLVFDNAGQDTVLLMAHKRHVDKGLFFYDVDALNSQDSKILVSKELCRKSTIQKNSIKWSSLVLSDDDLEFLNRLYSKSKKIGDYVESKPGIVTAANEFFIIDKATSSEFLLGNYTFPIIQKSMFVGKKVQFRQSDFEELSKAGKVSLFLDFNGYQENSCSGVENYLAIGVSKNFNERYKCRKRDVWYQVPTVKPGDGFFFKRCHAYPKLLKNVAGVYTTDTAYNIYLNEGIRINDITFSFYNPLTLCYAELLGRHYGGGVLELTPNEFKKLPMPYCKIDSKDFERFSRQFEKMNSIVDLLDIYGSKILNSSLNLEAEEIDRLMTLYQVLVNRRFGKSSKTLKI